MEQNNFLTPVIGIGVLFPIQLTKNENGETGWYPVNGDSQLILHNLNSIFQYLIGQRLRQEDFGSRIWECIEEPNTDVLSFVATEFIKQAIEAWESRILLKSVNVYREGFKLNIELTYAIKQTSMQQSLQVVYDTVNNTLN